MKARAAVLAFLLPAAAFAQHPPAPADIDKIFAAFDKPGSPGCALAVVRDGRIVYEHGYGTAELEWSIPITPATVFNIGSLSKQFVAASIVLLAEQGKLSLDDDIRKYVPELPRYEAPISLRQLLHHTSGVRDLLELMLLAGKDINTHYRIDEYVDILARQKEATSRPAASICTATAVTCCWASSCSARAAYRCASSPSKTSSGRWECSTRISTTTTG